MQLKYGVEDHFSGYKRRFKRPYLALSTGFWSLPMPLLPFPQGKRTKFLRQQKSDNRGIESTPYECDLITHRIHGAAIYGNMDPINIPPMLAYIPYMDPMGYDTTCSLTTWCQHDWNKWQHLLWWQGSTRSAKNMSHVPSTIYVMFLNHSHGMFLVVLLCIAINLSQPPDEKCDLWTQLWLLWNSELAWLWRGWRIVLQ